MLERQIGKLDEALQTLEEAIKKFPTFDKLYMIKGQIHEERNELPQAREAYAKGVKACPKSVPLWLLSSRLEEKAGITIKSRALLEKARMQNPKNEKLWAESVKVEERAGSAGQAKVMLARGKSCNCADVNLSDHFPAIFAAQQDCPSSGLLWSMAIWMEAAQQRKGRSVDAIKKSNEHPLVINAVGRLFWNERKIEKTRLWLSRAANADPDNGDLWAWWYKFEKQHGEKVRTAGFTNRSRQAADSIALHRNGKKT